MQESRSASFSRLRWGFVALIAAAAAASVKLDHPSPAEPFTLRRGIVHLPALPPPPDALVESEESCRDARGMVMPAGDAPELSCDEARRIVAEARAGLASAPEAVDPANFAGLTADWLDPHGLWSAAPDSPIARSLQRASERLLADLEGAPGSGPCASAEAVGTEMVEWVARLSGAWDEGFAPQPRKKASVRQALDLIARTPYEDGPVRRPALDLARAMGQHARAAEDALPLDAYVEVLRARVLPEKSPLDWSRIVLAAAVRAYVPLIDPHGAWAPLSEETAIYDIGLEVGPPPQLWSEMTRTLLGVRVDKGARAPLHGGDLVVEIDGRKLAGMSVEQSNQLGAILDDAAQVRILRGASGEPLDLVVKSEDPPQPSREGYQHLAWRSVPYGDGQVAVITIADVPDDLGERLQDVISVVESGHKSLGLVLDLRGNGGGSTDGAIDALGLFLPGAPLFPMRRRDGSLEIDRAPRPQATYGGPLAVLVDADSASAAEMLAGALSAYERATVVGTRTYGKGCAQEYIDDEVGKGVLRLTTLVFSLPDGTPLQRVGVLPHVVLDGAPRAEREATLAHAASSWRGPDVRDHALIGGPSFPNHGGRVGGSDDPGLFRALRSLGAARAAAR